MDKHKERSPIEELVATRMYLCKRKIAKTAPRCICGVGKTCGVLLALPLI